MKKKACRSCKCLYDGESCPSCGSSQTANSWQGRLHILNPEKSLIAHEVGTKKEAEYAIKIR
ncbi:DNA-directed RNA polymerase subunit E'' [Candidatus Woesearchaeota archaeon]|nr:DNA-directed RNA polymerase subunit E'' [Candidatus Woesearchaeota archaeon]HIH38760.1 DNA-directed RNA polymerase subunit E'' [Candidatus Woesearchaeota archaeon]HIH49176.1 DNA-directed RNA polymerase subunit E'' [Candidatus Woesearchaeota archaeon]HIJ03318.1 DNA-directed RNA polymerase subunit E'' [Candidatus Woesearchaeota archaeon]